MGYIWDVPLVMTHIAMENGHRNDVSFPMRNGDFYHGAVNVYQKVRWIYQADKRDMFDDSCGQPNSGTGIRIRFLAVF